MARTLDHGNRLVSQRQYLYYGFNDRAFYLVSSPQHEFVIEDLNGHPKIIYCKASTDEKLYNKILLLEYLKVKQAGDYDTVRGLEME